MKMRFTQSASNWALLVAGIAIVAPSIAAAQDAPPPQTVTAPANEPPVADTVGGMPQDPTSPQDQTGTSTDSGDIIVTGQRRAQRLQDVPASITAVSGATLQASNIQSPADIQYLAPSLTFNPQVGAGFQVRGVGSQGFDYNLEKSIAVVLDDVVQGLPRSIGLNTLSDVERVEVLKGPQGTLFGKNASGGVVFIVTRKPELGARTLEGHLRYGTDNEIQADNTINLPIGENAAARLTGVYQRRDGYLTNAFNGFKGGGYRDYQLRGKLLWEPTSNLELYLIGDIQHHDDDGTNQIETIRKFGQFTGGSTVQNLQQIYAPYGIVPGPENERYVNNAPNTNDADVQNLTGTITYKLGGYTLTSITGYKHQKSGNSTDPDNSPSDFRSLNVGTLRAHQFSQELRLNSPTGGFFDYIVGLYYYDSRTDAKEVQGGRLGANLPANTLTSPVGADANYVAKSTSYAAFGQANLHFTDKLTGIVGGRFTHDKVFGSFFKSINQTVNLIGTQIPDGQLGDSKSDFSVRGTIQYEPVRDVMFYGTYSQGYKAPAIATSRGVILPVASETVQNYEAGVKTQFFDRRLTLNVSVV